MALQEEIGMNEVTLLSICVCLCAVKCDRARTDSSSQNVSLAYFLRRSSPVTLQRIFDKLASCLSHKFFQMFMDHRATWNSILIHFHGRREEHCCLIVPSLERYDKRVVESNVDEISLLDEVRTCPLPSDHRFARDCSMTSAAKRVRVL